jgi:hypothetical protein
MHSALILTSGCRFLSRIGHIGAVAWPIRSGAPPIDGARCAIGPLGALRSREPLAPLFHDEKHLLLRFNCRLSIALTLGYSLSLKRGLALRAKTEFIEGEAIYEGSPYLKYLTTDSPPGKAELSIGGHEVGTSARLSGTSTSHRDGRMLFPIGCSARSVFWICARKSLPSRLFTMWAKV